MWIVYLPDNRRHSAWSTEEEAEHQANVLKAAGYDQPYSGLYGTIAQDQRVRVEFCPHTETTNGQYYV